MMEQAEQFIKRYQDKKVVEEYDIKRFTSKGQKLYDELFKQWAVKFLEFKEDDKVLDAGSGTGRFAIEFKKHTSDITAMDTSDEMLKTIEEKSEGKIKTENGSILDLPFQNDTFTKINCMLVLRHLDDDSVSTAIKEFNRILKKEGVLVFEAPNKRLLRYTEFLRNTAVTDRSFDLEQLERELNLNGFDVESRKGLYKFHIPTLYLILDKLPLTDWIRRLENRYNFGMQVILKCRKK